MALTVCLIKAKANPETEESMCVSTGSENFQEGWAASMAPNGTDWPCEGHVDLLGVRIISVNN